jgi:hypothetical protein
MSEVKMSPGETWRLGLHLYNPAMSKDEIMYRSRLAEQAYLREGRLDLLREVRAFLAKQARP